MPQVQGGDTAFVLIAAALVFLMTPGLALFYGGMVRSKNVLDAIMQSFIIISVISLEWIYLGYSMSFGPDVGGFIGNFSWLGLSGVGATPNLDYAPTIPQTVLRGLGFCRRAGSASGIRCRSSGRSPDFGPAQGIWEGEFSAP